MKRQTPRRSRVSPRLEAARSRVSPRLEAARSRVSPRLEAIRVLVSKRLTYVAFLVLLTAGCNNEIYSDYGVRIGAEKTSVNGTTVFSELFESAGYDVSTRKHISPRLSEYDVVVWTPDDFQPPSIAQRVGIESWLSKGPRTLIFVGRDYDAMPKYWDAIFHDAPPDQQVDVWREREFARSTFAARRRAIPDDALARWFILKNRGNRELVTGVEAADPTWLEGIDTSKLEISVQSYFDTPNDKDLQSAQKGVKTLDSTEYSMHFDNAFGEFDFTDGRRQARLPTEFKVLLETDTGIPLITEVHDPSWRGSKIIMIPNGSFLLNLPLVNHEHRKLAQRLIGQCDGQRVGFLYTNANDRDMHAVSDSGTLPGLAAFTTWPIGFIIFHAFLLGTLVLFSKFPILGRPRVPIGESTADFGKHIRAIGRLLGRNSDSQHAYRAIAKYQGQHGENAGKSSTNPPNSP